MKNKEIDKNQYLKAILVRISVLLIIAIMICLYMLVKHAHVFPELYLTEHREKELTELSEKILENLDEDLVVSRHGSIDGMSDFKNRKTMDVIKEMNRFCNINDFSVIRVSIDEGLVIFRHHIIFRYVTDYVYRKHSDNSEITTRTYKR